jgi:hypothetical protein
MFRPRAEIKGAPKTAVLFLSLRSLHPFPPPQRRISARSNAFRHYFPPSLVGGENDLRGRFRRKMAARCRAASSFEDVVTPEKAGAEL